MTRRNLAAQLRYNPSGYAMIKSIQIKNFRCFKDMEINRCKRINVIVGDNGSGKTALLEAVFMTLCSSTDIALRLRQQRGLEGNVSGSSREIEKAVFGDFFYNRDMSKVISIKLDGNGPEARSLRISRGAADAILPLELSAQSSSASTSPLVFSWVDYFGNEKQVSAQVTPRGFHLSSTGEDLPDFFLFGSNQTINSTETASRFSELSRSRRERQFVEIFTKEYDWIEDLNIEVVAGAPVIHATLRDTSEKVPVNNISGAINRVLAIMLCLAVRPRTVVLVDEMENGLYHKHHAAIWRSVLGFAREYDGQLFTTTHSEEWLGTLVDAAGDDLDDIALWRMERTKEGPLLRQFTGRQAAAAIKVGEVR